MGKYSVVILLIFCGFCQKSQQIWHQNEQTTKPPNQLDRNWYTQSSSDVTSQNGVIMHHNYSRTVSYQGTAQPGVKGKSFGANYVNEFPEATTSKHIQRIAKKHETHTLTSQPLVGETTEPQGYLECPYQATGQFPYALDCKQFLNCFKGRGSIQNCAGGSAFNPHTLECDYPDKFKCNAYKSQSDIFQQSGNLFQTMFSDRNLLVKLHAAALQKQVECPRGANGLHPNPHDCKSYLLCENGNTKIEQCQSGKLFNSVISSCDYPENVHCTHENEREGRSGINPRQDFELITPVVKTTYQQRSYQKRTVQCPENFSGLLPHPICTKFLNCDNGRTFVQDCGPGTVFNPKISTCDWPHNVNCQDSYEDGNSEYVSGSNNQGFNVLEKPRHQHGFHFPNHNHHTPEFHQGNWQGVRHPYNGHSYGEPEPEPSWHTSQNSWNHPPSRYPPDYNVWETTTESRNFMDDFVEFTGQRLRRHDVERYSIGSANTCAQYCLSTKFYNCKSFSYRQMDRTCILNDAVVGDTGDMEEAEGFMYYERKTHTINCDDKFRCDNHKCVNMTQVCNKEDNCGDNSDEWLCATDVKFKIRLADGKSANEGRLEVQAFGRWGGICDDKFDIRDANVACKELGFPLGAVEVRHDIYNSHAANPLILMDNVECLGNETSLQNCSFNGWGIHNCKPEEVVGVVCKTATVSCPNNYWLCRQSMECIPILFLCDHVEDCDDKTDEKPEHCESKFQVRLVNGSSPMQGRVEVRHFGVWGTVCDDDFNDAAADVVCKTLGYRGPSRAGKGGFYGPGKGPIWLDQVMCNGNESSLEKCLHNDWGIHNCDHSEDAVVTCSRFDNRPPKKVPPKEAEERFTLADIMPTSCGLRGDAIIGVHDEIQARVVAGSIAKKGHYPWQASLRIKGQGKTSHWCGAVVVTPIHVLSAAHCLMGFHKGTYVIKAGDYESEVYEGTEQEAYIEEYYIHEDFRKGGHHMNNDIAVVKLKGAGFRLGEHIRAICLPDVDIALTPGNNCTISGWGSTQSGKLSASLQLRSGWVPIQAQDVCKQPHVYGPTITDGMFCAGSLEEGVDTCDGDSGGPLVCLNNGLFTLYGLTSFGQHCGYANKPGVYVNVGHYRQWIDQTIEKSLK